MIASTVRPVLAALFVMAFAAAPAFAVHDDAKVHHLAIQVDQNDPAVMNLALNNAVNAVREYESRGESVEVEIVAYGPGLHMYRADSSPVAERVKSIGEGMPAISFSGCGNTKAAMERKAGEEIALLPDVAVVPAGVVRLMELQEQGWSYVRP